MFIFVTALSKRKQILSCKYFVENATLNHTEIKHF